MSGGEGVRNPADLTPILNVLDGIEFFLWMSLNQILNDIEVVDGVVDAILVDTTAILELAVQIDDATQHVTSIFPADTYLTCTLEADDDAHVWSGWTEIVDNAAHKLSDLFADAAGHITSILIETVSDDAALYMFEIAWGAAKTPITSGRFAGIGKFQAAHIQDRFWAPPFPAGALIYYRMKTDTAVADTCTVHFRYHAH